MAPSEPHLPPAGWYDDPDQPVGPQRWWDGRAWTEARQTPTPVMPNELAAPMSPSFSNDSLRPDFSRPPGIAGERWSGNQRAQEMPSPVADLNVFPRVAVTLAAGWTFCSQHWKPISVIAALCMGIPGMIALAVTPTILDVYIPAITGTQVPSIGFGFLLALVALVVASFLPMVGTMAASALALGAYDRRYGSATADAEAPTLSAVFSRSFVLFGWALLIYLVASVAFSVFSFPLVAADSGALVVLAAVAIIGLTAWLSVRWAFVPLAITEGHNVPFRRSSEVSKGRFWRVLGQLLAVGLLFGVVPYVMSVIISLTAMAIGGTEKYVIPVTTSIGVRSVIIEVPGLLTGAVAGLLIGLVYGVLYYGAIMGAKAHMYRAAPEPQPGMTTPG